MKISRNLLFIVLVSLTPFFYFFTSPNLAHTHDGLVHIPRIAAFFKALIDGQIPVRWAGDLNHGYGMPLFIFIYHTPYLVASFFLLLGFGLVLSFKLSLLLSFLLSGVFMYLFAKAFFKDEKKALLVSAFYQFAPFHLVDLLIRGSFGEVYTYAFLPLVLYGITKFYQTKKYRFFFLTSLATGFLIISHNSISLLFFSVATLFALVFVPTRREKLLVLFSLFLGLLLAFYYWVPALLEHKYTYGDLFMKNVYKDRFPQIWKFFIPNFTDTKLLQTDSISLQFGVFHLIALGGACFLLFKKKLDMQQRSLVLFSLFLIVGSFFFMLKLSLLFWENISFLRQFQFPWRFLSVGVVALSLLAAFLSPFLKKPYYWLVLLAVILSTFSYWQPKEGYDTIDEKYYSNFPLNTTYYGETDVIWSAGPAKSYPKNFVEIVSGKGKLATFVLKQSNYQTFAVDASSDIDVVSHTQYFPGWRVYREENGQKKSVPIQFQDPNYRGLIKFSLPKGMHNITIQFEESKIRLLADCISLVSFVGLIGFLFVKKKQI